MALRGHPGTAGDQRRARPLAGTEQRGGSSVLLVPSRRLPELSLILGSGQTSRRTDGRSASGARRGGKLPSPAPTEDERGARSRPRTPRPERDPRYGERGETKRHASRAAAYPERRCPNAPPGPGTGTASGRVARRSPSRTKAPGSQVQLHVTRRSRAPPTPPHENIAEPRCVRADSGMRRAKVWATASPPPRERRERGRRHGPVRGAPKFGEGNPQTLAP